MKIIPLLLVMGGVAFGQGMGAGCEAISGEAAKRRFEVASVKAAEAPQRPFVGNPFAVVGGPGSGDPGRFATAHTSLAYLIERAYGLEPDQLKGPEWLTDAMGSGYAVSVTMPASTTGEEFCGMLRNLLAERFHLAVHTEKQARPGYELTVLPGGPKFRKFVAGPAGGDGGRGGRVDADGFPVLPADQATGLVFRPSASGLEKMSFRNSVAEFARILAANLAREGGPGAALPRVVDKTGLAGIYDIRIEFVGAPFPLVGRGGGGAAAVGDADAMDAGPGILEAVQKQLGLKLTKVSGVQVDVIVVDRVDRVPTEN